MALIRTAAGPGITELPFCNAYLWLTRYPPRGGRPLRVDAAHAPGLDHALPCAFLASSRYTHIRVVIHFPVRQGFSAAEQDVVRAQQPSSFSRSIVATLRSSADFGGEIVNELLLGLGKLVLAVG